MAARTGPTPRVPFRRDRLCLPGTRSGGIRSRLHDFVCDRAGRRL